MAAINLRSYADGRKQYRVRIRRHGLLVSRQFASRAEAEAFARTIEGDLAGRGPAEATTLAALIDMYEPHRPASYGTECLAYWREKLGPKRLGEITSAMIRAHRDELARTPARSHNYKTARIRSAATTRKYLIVLGAVYQYATRELLWAIPNPVKLVPKPKANGHRIRSLTDDERTALLAAAKKSDSVYLYAAVLLSLTTGMRKGELHSLLWADVDLAAGTAVLRRTKNGETRGVALTANTIAALSTLPRGDDPRAFSAEQTKAFLTAVRRAGLANFRWHDMRHDMGTRLASRGVSTRLITEAMGQRTLTMALVYQNVSAAATRETVLRVMGDLG